LEDFSCFSVSVSVRRPWRVTPSSISYPCVFVRTAQQILCDLRRTEQGRLILILRDAEAFPRAVASAAPLRNLKERFPHGAGDQEAIFRPSFSAVVCPVRNRHQSTAKPRMMAMTICLRRRVVVLLASNWGCHFLTNQ